jgi:hypothetical protein
MTPLRRPNLPSSFGLYRLRQARRRLGPFGRRGPGRLAEATSAAYPFSCLLDEARPEELLRYTATLADTVIVGCSSVREVRENLAVARDFAPMSDAAMRALEARIAPHAASYDTFKA